MPVFPLQQNPLKIGLFLHLYREGRTAVLESLSLPSFLAFFASHQSVERLPPQAVINLPILPPNKEDKSSLI